MRHSIIILCFLTTHWSGLKAQRESITIAGSERYYQLIIPDSYAQGEKQALILALHGYHHDVASFPAYSGLDTLAKNAGFIVAYPEATVSEAGFYFWNAGNISDENTSNVNDVEFINSLIGRLEAQYNIDSQKIFIVGYSNGAMMAYRLAALLSNKIAAVACVSGTLVDTVAKPVCPVSILHIHGDADMAVPHTGTKEYGLKIPPVDDAIRNWINWNACSTVPKILTYNSSLTALQWIGNAEVRLYLLHGLGHDWPSVERCGWGATETILEFFKLQKKPPCL